MSFLACNDAQYSSVAKGLHWLTALAVVFLFALGLWMVRLDYYHEWYQRAPALHMGVGVALALLTLLRLGYRGIHSYPQPVPGTGRTSVIGAKAAHAGLYFLLLFLSATGYFIVTAEGESLSVFGLFDIPAVVYSGNNLQDRAGELHKWSSYLLVGLALAHGGAALWHHFVVRDDTLLRMISKAREGRKGQH